jgi:hypothetical protein
MIHRSSSVSRRTGRTPLSDIVLNSVDQFCCPYGAAQMQAGEPERGSNSAAAHDFRSFGFTFGRLARVFSHTELPGVEISASGYFAHF